MIGKIILIIISIAFLCLGVFLLLQNIKLIKSANKCIRDCKDAYKRQRDETFLRLESIWKILRNDNYMGIPMNLFIIIINMINIIFLIISLV